MKLIKTTLNTGNKMNSIYNIFSVAPMLDRTDYLNLQAVLSCWDSIGIPSNFIITKNIPIK